MSNNTIRRNGKVYTEAKINELEFLNNGKLVDLSRPQKTLEVAIGDVYEIEDNER